MKKYLLTSLILILSYGSLSANHHEKKHNKKNVQFFGKFGYGLLGVLQHNSQWGKDKTDFSYVESGGQDVLFPNWRAEAGVLLNKKHKMSLLYQPIFVSTQSVLTEDLLVDNITFEAGTNLRSTYDFPFYRFSYWYLLAHSEHFDFWLGAGLQIRNANIKFEDGTGSKAFRTGNIGPVPLINLASEIRANSSFSVYLAGTGFWAPIKYINGGSTDINGWIYEFDIEPTFSLKDDLKAFLGFRILGGGAIGTSNSERTSGGKFSSDVLLTTSFIVGLTKTY